ncbi:uncharacterized protein LOC129281179 [Lytechinus pictus]|uniref:uncharacterized protein LOC129281179 n=1 Tax=Lytechinus pictus TaxID=7653 RepID=UPI0030BA1695
MGAQGSKDDQNTDTGRNMRKDVRIMNFYERISNGQVLNPSLLLGYFPEYSRPLIERIFTLERASGTVDEEKFFYVVNKILAPSSSASLSKFYFESFCGSESLQEKDVELLVSTAFSLFLVSCEISLEASTLDQETQRLLVHSIVSQGTSGAGLEWMENHCGELLMGMQHWFLAQINPVDDVDSATAREYTLPDHEGALLSIGMWWALSSSLPSIYTESKTNSSSVSSGESSKARVLSKQPWTLLYSSREHGLSVNRLQHHVFGYKGPTVLVISFEGGFMYAVGLDTEWREGTVPWGGSSCVAVRLAPEYSITEEGEYMVLFNEKSRNLPKGLFIGRDPKRRLLSITEGLQTITHKGLTASVVNAEVWGCASTDVKQEQAKQKKTELKDAERNAKVKLPGQWDDNNPDRLLLEWGTTRTDYADAYREEKEQS